MRHRLLRGAAAGAVGTVALNAVTYLDMALHARPASSTPEQSVQELADRAGVDLGEGEEAANRRSGLGPLLGQATGVGIGVLYGLAAARLDGVPWLGRALGTGLVAMVGTSAPMTALGLTDPRQWDATSWVSDAVPHLAYGLATAAAFDLLGEDRPAGR